MAGSHNSAGILTKDINIVSFNMHGFNQGIQTVRDMMLLGNFDVFMLQEHWLTPFNLQKFNENCPKYICYGSSAMGSEVESGVLRGRPYGGVMTLVNNRFHSCAHIVCSDDRYVIVTVGDLLIINVYLPCAGSVNRSLICQDILENLVLWIDKYPNMSVIFGGDLNTDLNDNNPVSDLVNKFIVDSNLTRGDHLFPSVYHSTYYNESLNCHSTVDFLLTGNDRIVTGYNVIDPAVNFSDHRPVVISCTCTVDSNPCPAITGSRQAL